MDKKKKQLWSRVSTGTEPIRIPLDTGIVGQCVVHNKPLRIDDAYECKFFNQDVDRKTGYKTTSVLAMPVRSSSGEVLGALQVINKQEMEGLGTLTFDENDELMLGSLCDHIAVAVAHCAEPVSDVQDGRSRVPEQFVHRGLQQFVGARVEQRPGRDRSIDRMRDQHTRTVARVPRERLTTGKLLQKQGGNGRWCPWRGHLALQ